MYFLSKLFDILGGFLLLRLMQQAEVKGIAKLNVSYVTQNVKVPWDL